MNKLNRPAYDDDAALDALATNVRVLSYPALQVYVPILKAAYAQYVSVNGDVRSVRKVILPEVIANYLRGHYGEPPRSLSHITEIRNLSDAKTCPMCGSLHSGTLDHVMDKHSHPAFSIFAQNLVPACKCNSKRPTALVGSVPGERILHPYFDAILSERIIAARFSDLGMIPQIETRVVLDPSSPYFLAAGFHHDSIIMRTGIYTYLRSLWNKLILRPAVIIPDLKINPRSKLDLINILWDERDRNDALRETKNNWDSIFLSGLCESNVVDWLYDRLTQTGRQPRASLLSL